MIKRLLKKLVVWIAGIMLAVSHAQTVKPQPVNEAELTAAVLIAEAGGEGVEGMKCVMEVIRNRMSARKLSMRRIVTEKYAFSAYNKWRTNPQGFINKWKTHPRYNQALWIVKYYKGNLTKGALYYHEKKVKPAWSRDVTPTSVVGRHLFFANIAY
jgi:spore germination cell wall hydrolase CwlJ-like protein